MTLVNKVSIYIPTAREIDQAARAAIENIDKQLRKMPPVKKPASAADNFPGIYNNWQNLNLIVGNRESAAKAKLASKAAINQYRSAG